MQRTTAGPAFLLLLALLIAACGGGAATSPDDGDGTGGGGAGGASGSAQAPATTDDPAESGAPAASEASGGGGGGGSALGAAVCDLATGEEVSGVFGVEAATLYDPIAENTCFVKTAEDRTLVHWTTTGDGQMMFDALSGSAPTVDGLGDRAAYAEGFGLMIVKGDTMVTIVIPAEADLSSDEVEDAAKQVGAFIAGRL